VEETKANNEAKNDSVNTKASNQKSMHSQQVFTLKKTGKDQGVQIDTNKIFNFDQEVKSIVAVITTKTIEQSLWEVEKELEIKKMKDKRSGYQNKDIETKEKFKQFVEKEIDQANSKYAMINKLTQSNKHMATKQLQNIYDNMNSSTRKPEENTAEKYLKSLQKKTSNDLQVFIEEEFLNLAIKKSEEMCSNSSVHESELGNLYLGIEKTALVMIFDRVRAYTRLY
jgi:hypothetical protein